MPSVVASSEVFTSLGSSRSHLTSIFIPSMDTRSVPWEFSLHRSLLPALLLLPLLPHDRRRLRDKQPLCNSANGTFVTLDEDLPLTRYAHTCTRSSLRALRVTTRACQEPQRFSWCVWVKVACFEVLFFFCCMFDRAPSTPTPLLGSGGGLSGQVAAPTRNTGYENKFRNDVSIEQTSINLPSRNVGSQQECDPTIAASEDLNLPQQYGAPCSPQNTAASAVPLFAFENFERDRLNLFKLTDLNA